MYTGRQYQYNRHSSSLLCLATVVYLVETNQRIRHKTTTEVHWCGVMFISRTVRTPDTARAAVYCTRFMMTLNVPRTSREGWASRMTSQ